MHPVDSFIIPAHKIVCAQNVFWVVVPDVQQAVIFPVFLFSESLSLRPAAVDSQSQQRQGLPFLLAFWQGYGIMYKGYWNFPILSILR